MYTLDANIFARDTDPTDPLYPACRALLEALDQRQIPIIVPNLLLAEVAAAVSRTRHDPIRARIITDAITAFPHVKLIPLNDSLAKEAAELADDRALRGADACMWRSHCGTIVSSFRWIANSVSAQHRLFALSHHLKRWLSLAELGGEQKRTSLLNRAMRLRRFPLLRNDGCCCILGLLFS
jgi:predicted nucleic acid-binding protein